MLIQGGKIRGLAITSETRSPLAGEVPATRGAGFPAVNRLGMRK